MDGSITSTLTHYQHHRSDLKRWISYLNVNWALKGRTVLGFA